ncbi:hypothetical protein NUW54_g2931 [Trametes sanguinea]|uniref:Uncharacterized protein n=1 Tax=Trametes sanguinea TaxID=158606 RepID=A0ACC1Q265_9APHY|nr:hypothetical protein NUW54_g2931 [Trametes sanguinea]
MFGDCPTTGWRKYATYQKNRWKLALVMEVVVRDDVPEPPEKANIPPPCPFVKWVGDRGSDDGGRVRVLDLEDDARPRVFHDVGNAPGEPTSIRQHQTAITPHAWHGAHDLPGTGWFYVNPLFLPFFHVQGPMGKEGLKSEKKMAVVTARFDGTTSEMAPQNGFGNGFPDVGWKLEGYTYHVNDDGGGDGCGGTQCRLVCRSSRLFLLTSPCPGANLLWCLTARRTAGRPQQGLKAPPQTPSGGTGLHGGDDNDGDDDDTQQPLSTSPLVQYSISQTRCMPVHISKWLVDHKKDPATKNFIPLLRSHIFGRLMDCRNHDEFTASELDCVHIDTDRIYRHKVLCLNHTTYDMCREQDVINPRTHPNIMVLSDNNNNNTDMPYWYAQVLDIFHAYVRYNGPGSTRAARRWSGIDFVWVRWYEHNSSYPSGFLERRLPHLRFADASDPDTLPFGFLDPSKVVRVAYLIPAFAHSTTDDLLGPSKLARRAADIPDQDYEYYYVEMFADRDMYMRHLGGGVGHRGMGVSLVQLREHMHRCIRAVTPDVLLDKEDDDDGRSARGVDSAKADLAEEPKDWESEEPAEDSLDADEDWQFDAGLRGLFEDASQDVFDEGEVEDAGEGYYDEEGGLVVLYSMEGFAPL